MERRQFYLSVSSVLSPVPEFLLDREDCESGLLLILWFTLDVEEIAILKCEFCAINEISILVNSHKFSFTVMCHSV